MACSSSCGSRLSERNSKIERGNMFRSKPALIFVTALCFSVLAALSGTMTAHADNLPVVEITAKRFAFSPDRITLKKGNGQASSPQRGRHARLFPASAQTRRGNSRRPNHRSEGHARNGRDLHDDL